MFAEGFVGELCMLFSLGLGFMLFGLAYFVWAGKNGSKAEQAGYAVGKSLLWRMLRGK